MVMQNFQDSATSLYWSFNADVVATPTASGYKFATAAGVPLVVPGTLQLVLGDIPVATPILTLAQQAEKALGAGLEIISSIAGISGTYACDADAQVNLGQMYSLIQRSGGATFPAGLPSLAWADKDGTPHVFTSVAEFLALETAIGNYVLVLDQIALTNSGVLPIPTTTIS